MNLTNVAHINLIEYVAHINLIEYVARHFIESKDYRSLVNLILVDQQIRSLCQKILDQTQLDLIFLRFFCMGNWYDNTKFWLFRVSGKKYQELRNELRHYNTWIHTKGRDDLITIGFSIGFITKTIVRSEVDILHDTDRLHALIEGHDNIDYMYAGMDACSPRIGYDHVLPMTETLIK